MMGNVNHYDAGEAGRRLKISDKDWIRGGSGVKFLLENDGVPTSGENNGASPVCMNA
jgi:hypothetical protein